MVIITPLIFAGDTVTPAPERVPSDERFRRDGIDGKHGASDGGNFNRKGIGRERRGKETQRSDDGECDSGRGGRAKAQRTLNSPDRVQSAILPSYHPQSYLNYNCTVNPSDNGGGGRQGGHDANTPWALKEQQMIQELNRRYHEQRKIAMESPHLTEKAKKIGADLMQTKPSPGERINNPKEGNAQNVVVPASDALPLVDVGPFALPVIDDHPSKTIQVEKAESRWETRYKELAAYAREHGNANVPKRNDQNRALNSWVGNQRRMFKQDKLSQERISSLLKIDFQFDLQEQRGWNARYAELVLYVREHGNANVRQRCEKNRALSSWVTSQRRMFKQDKLSQEQISSLLKIDFHFSLQEQPGWNARYAELALYVREHGNANVPNRKDQNYALGKWVLTQRQMFKQDKLSQEKITRLRQLGFEFSLQEQPRWDVRYAELVLYVQEHGNADVPQIFEQNRGLGKWVHTQRTMFKRDKLSQERTSCLRHLGFEFSRGQSGWDARYSTLVTYVREHGNANVPNRHDQNRALGRWVRNQRTMFKRDKLSQKQIVRLRKLGFEFSLQGQLGWDARYAELASYVREHGNANVPNRHDQNRALGRWVTSQRTLFNQDKLSQERINSLLKVDFVFSLRQATT